MRMYYYISAFFCACVCVLVPTSYSYDPLADSSFTDSFFRHVMSRMGGQDLFRDNGGPDLVRDNSFDYNNAPNSVPPEERRSHEQQLRDEEYLEHSSLYGNMYVQGGAGEGYQRLKPSGSVKNVDVIKTDKILPSFCTPANPCPIGYTERDGCLEEFENTAAFSRKYQAMENCMCDSEHMFDCPGSTRENEINTLARTFENEGLADIALDRLIKTMDIEGEHKNLVAKKFFSQQPLNPYLEGEKLPVVAKKAPQSSII